MQNNLISWCQPSKIGAALSGDYSEETNKRKTSHSEAKRALPFSQVKETTLQVDMGLITLKITQHSLHWSLCPVTMMRELRIWAPRREKAYSSLCRVKGGNPAANVFLLSGFNTWPKSLQGDIWLNWTLGVSWLFIINSVSGSWVPQYHFKGRDEKLNSKGSNTAALLSNLPPPACQCSHSNDEDHQQAPPVLWEQMPLGTETLLAQREIWSTVST